MLESDLFQECMKNIMNIAINERLLIGKLEELLHFGGMKVVEDFINI